MRLLTKLRKEDAEYLKNVLEDEFSGRFSFSTYPMPESNLTAVNVAQVPSRKLLVYVSGAVRVLTDKATEEESDFNGAA